jgi:hypothetical protein
VSAVKYKDEEEWDGIKEKKNNPQMLETRN